jgi:hypothetical protein
MLQPLVLIVAIAAAGAPASAPPQPAATAAPQQQLKEIGRVTTNAMCTAIVMRANSAIGAALRNDQTVGLAVATLKRVDLDTNNAIDKRKSVSEIERLANDLRNSSGGADAQIKKLREMAEQATDPERKADLKEFADALGGALARQKRIGADLQRMLTIMEGREARESIRRDVAFANPGLPLPGASFDKDYDTKHYNEMARAAAKELEERTLSIAADESKAAEHIVGAVNGCS